MKVYTAGSLILDVMTNFFCFIKITRFKQDNICIGSNRCRTLQINLLIRRNCFCFFSGQFQLFIIFFGLPGIGITLDAFPSAVIAFGMNLGAYNAEVFRSSIQAIPKGQLEAAYMIGLSYPTTMRRIILPQSFPIAFPSLFNNLISLLKDTSLASSITVIELFTTAQQIAARTYEPFALYCEAAVIYLIFSTFLTWLQGYLESKLVWRSRPGSDAGRNKAIIG